MSMFYDVYVYLFFYLNINITWSYPYKLKFMDPFLEVGVVSRLVLVSLVDKDNVCLAPCGYKIRGFYDVVVE